MLYQLSYTPKADVRDNALPPGWQGRAWPWAQFKARRRERCARNDVRDGMHPLRRRMENSEWLMAGLARLTAGYARLCLRTARWETEGFDDLRATLREGPVMLLMWHSRLFMAPAHLEPVTGFVTLRDPSPAGRLAGAMQARFGMLGVGVSARSAGAAATREVLRRLKSGDSVGLTGDGPKGPARALKTAPLEWARVTGVPVYLYAYACTRQRRLDSWDNMLIPRPFGRGHVAVARWEQTVPRRADEATRAALQQDLQAALDAHQARVDAALGLPPGA